MKSRLAALLWLALSVVVLTLYFRQEGFHMRPAPTHWWWYAFSAAVWGFSVGQQWNEWQQRRAARRFERAVQSLRVDRSGDRT